MANSQEHNPSRSLPTREDNHPPICITQTHISVQNYIAETTSIICHQASQKTINRMELRTKFVVFWMVVLELCAWMFSLAGNFMSHFWNSQCRLLL